MLQGLSGIFTLANYFNQEKLVRFAFTFTNLNILIDVLYVCFVPKLKHTSFFAKVKNCDANIYFYVLAFLKQEAEGLGLFYASCPSDWFLLSCGTESTVMGKFDPMIYAIAFDAQTCECYNIYGMKCSAWCTDKPLTDQGHQITLVGKSTTDSICPYGSKMISCSRKPMLTPGSNIKIFTNAQPNEDGCTCTDNEGAWCVASCAVNVKNREVIAQTGFGKLQLSCTKPGNSILGCGTNTSNMASENWPYAFVLNKTTCQCFADYSYWCYAVCGNLFTYV